MFVHSNTALARSRAQHTASPPSVHPVGWHVESRSDPSLQTMSISTRCSFKTSNIVPTPPPYSSPGYIYINWIYGIHTYTYVGLLPLPSSLAKAMPPQDSGRPQAPRRRRVALAVQAAPAPHLFHPPKQPEQGIPRIGPQPAPPPPTHPSPTRDPSKA